MGARRQQHFFAHFPALTLAIKHKKTALNHIEALSCCNWESNPECQDNVQDYTQISIDSVFYIFLSTDLGRGVKTIHIHDSGRSRDTRV